MGRKKKNRNQPDRVKVIVLITVILQLIDRLIGVIQTLVGWLMG